MTGPQRCRRELRGRTTGLRVLAHALAAPSTLRASFPGELTGAGMMALFGARLRSLLNANGHADTSSPHGRTQLPFIDRPTTPPHPGSINDLRPAVRRHSSPDTRTADDSESTREPAPGTRSAVSRQRDPGHALPFERDQANATSSEATGRTASRSTPGETNPPAPASPVTLTTLLAQYFATTAHGSAHRAPGRSISAGARADERSTETTPAPSQQPSPAPQPTWRDVEPARQGSRHPLLPPADWPRSAAHRLGSDRQATTGGRPAPVSVSRPLVATESDPADFGDLMADVLREQALRYGIDLS